MTAERKNLQKELNSLQTILRQYEWQKELFIKYSTETKYKNSVKYIKDIIKDLKAKIIKLPIGFKYDGTYYIRKPYTNPLQVEKLTGGAFMREDLISWDIDKRVSREGKDGKDSTDIKDGTSSAENKEDNEDNYYDYQNFSRVREIFRDANLRDTIPKDEAEPVFESEEK